MHRLNRSNRNWNRSQRRRYQESDTDIVKFDWNRPLPQIVYEILQHISLRDLVPKSQILVYLNYFTKYCQKRFSSRDTKENEPPVESGAEQLPQFSDSEILSCLRIALFHDVAEVRAAALRAMRYFVQSSETMRCLLELNLQHLIARSLDIVLENHVERVQALRLLRHLLAIEPSIFPLALGRCLCAMASDNSLEKDALLRACWATISELTVVNSLVSARSGCINVLVKCVLNSAAGSTSGAPDRNQMTMTNGSGNGHSHLSIAYTNVAQSEAILSSFLYLFNFPETRRLLQPNGADIFHFISPFTDTYSFLHSSNAAREQQRQFDDLCEEEYRAEAKENKFYPFNKANKHNSQQQFASYEQRTLRYLACKNSILSIMRSWPGFIFMSRVSSGESSSKFTSLSNGDDQWNYENLYREVDGQSIRVLHDSLRFFGCDPQAMPRRLTQMVTGIDKALRTCTTTSSYFATAALGTLNPLESLVSMLHLPYPEVHRHILELFFELFGFKPPEWSDNFEDVLLCLYFTQMPRQFTQSASVKDFYPEEWQLYEGFVAKEGEHVLPSLGPNRLNFIVNYYALLLQCLVEFGLLEALVSLILDSNERAAINLATVLIGELLHLSGKYLPSSEYAHRCQSLPSLVAASMSDCRTRRNRAMMTIANLKRIHNLKKHGPQPASLFLEQQLLFCQPQVHQPKPQKKARSQSMTKLHDEHVLNLIRSSGVQRKNAFREWKWDLISEVIRHPVDVMIHLEDKEVRNFTRRLVDFFKPTRKQFSMVSRTSSLGSNDPHSLTRDHRGEHFYCEDPRLLCVIATHFVDFLLRANETRAAEFLEEFVLDLEMCLKNIATKSPSADEIFIPSRLLSTLSNHYFLLIGRFTHTASGRSWLEKTNILQHLLELISLATNEVYIKLTISSLDYAEYGFARSLLSKVLTSTLESARVYSTQLLRVLLRARCNKFIDWGIGLLITQLYDQSSVVSFEALDILDEACSEDGNTLERLIAHRPAIFQLGDHGIIFFTRFASHPSGFSFLKETNMLENELNRWASHFALRYVRIVEDALNECFTCHQKGNTGKYGRRSDRRHFPNLKRVSMTNYLAPHLYGQLVQTHEGVQIVRQRAILTEACRVMKEHMASYLSLSLDETSQPSSPNEADLLRIKSALWILGHVASSEDGLEYVLECEEPLLSWVVYLAGDSLVISIRSTCFYVLCLVSSTRKGADLMSELGWSAIQHSHDDMFPIDQTEYEHYHQSRPRVWSDLNTGPQKPIVSITSTSCLPSAVGELESAHSVAQLTENRARKPSQSSSHSSASSYLTMHPTAGSTQTKSVSESEREPPKHTFTISSSSSTTSIYSNASSVASLLNNIPASTMSHNRPRSSSDCVVQEPVSKLAESKVKLKPECQDSGIMDQLGDSLGKGMEPVSPEVDSGRTRKISAPCFPSNNCGSSTVGVTNRECRSDSNDSAHPASRSTSFAEYSSSSSASNTGELTKTCENVRNAISSEKKAILLGERNPTIPRNGLMTKRQMSMFSNNNNDDPYLSQVDAHGYAQLRAIQKRRVQSLSGNMFFSGLATPTTLVDLINLEKEYTRQTSSQSTKSRTSSNCKMEETTPEIVINEQPITSADRQRKFSNFMSFGNELASILRIPSRNGLIDMSSSESMVNSGHGTMPRTMSRVSRTSNQSDDSLGLGYIEEMFNMDDQVFAKPPTKFMCLCLPQQLSYLFHIDETATRHENRKLDTRRVQFPEEINNNNNNHGERQRKISTISRPPSSVFSVNDAKSLFQNEGLDLHTSSNCIGCCFRSSQGYPAVPSRKSSAVERPTVTFEIDSDSRETLVETDGTQSNRTSSTTITVPPLVLQRKEVLRLVNNLSAAVYAKQSEQGLLSLKQKFPSVFEDCCLYSEVCLQMETNSYKATARRFLHELFLDVTLDQFYKDAEMILRKYAHLNTSNQLNVQSLAL